LARLSAGTEVDVNLAPRKPEILECKGDRRRGRKKLNERPEGDRGISVLFFFNPETRE
jgi:hypothetical protein